MLYTLLVTLFVLLCFFLMVLILVQKSKGSIGIGNLGGGMQMLFGGSGGQSLFQKATWIAGAVFMALSLFLAILKTRGGSVLERRSSPEAAEITIPAQSPTAPAAPQEPASTPVSEESPKPAQ